MKKLMKFLFFSSVLILCLGFVRPFENEADRSYTIVNVESDYCDGWEDGYCEGWKDVKGQYAICPVTPICPIAEIDCSEGYRCGYNRGFKAGMKAAENE